MFIYVLCASDEPLQVRYVGKAADVRKRVYHHLADQESKTLKQRWIESVAKRGAVIEWFVVEKVVGDVNDAERRWIAYYPVGQLTNATPGGDGGATWTGRKHTAETRALMSAALAGRTGHRFTDEQKARLSASRRGRKFTAEKRARYSKAQAAYWASLTPDQRAALAEKKQVTRQATAAKRASLISCVLCRKVMDARYATDRHRAGTHCVTVANSRRRFEAGQVVCVSCVVCRMQITVQTWSKHQHSQTCVQAAQRLIQ